jgi:Tfp pilus assembly protein PilF
MWLGILGLILAAIGVVMSHIVVIVIAVAICLVGALHISVQWRNKEFRAKMHYNRGVKYFNRLQYQLAQIAFERALEINPNHKLANYGITRIGIYNQ